MKNYSKKWIIQRITAFVLIPLTFWFIYNCLLLASLDYYETKAFFFSKINSSLYFILTISMLYHSKLGCETIVEDYVTSQKLKYITKSLISLLTYLLMIIVSISIFSMVMS